MARDVPISTAKAMGPARSPTVLPTPRPFSAKVDAHWLTPCSLAPAHSIISRNTQNILFRASSPMVMPRWPSSSSAGMGTRRKANRLPSGTSAHTSASTRQCAVPNRAKNAVDSSTTPTWPQQ